MSDLLLLIHSLMKLALVVSVLALIATAPSTAAATAEISRLAFDVGDKGSMQPTFEGKCFLRPPFVSPKRDDVCRQHGAGTDPLP